MFVPVVICALLGLLIIWILTLPGMFRLLTRKLFFETIPALLVISFFTFVIIHAAPGGPFDQEKEAAPGVRERIEAHYGLDKPLLVQYAQYMKNALRGDLGPSYGNSAFTVTELIREKLPVSMELGFYALCFAIVVGMVSGVFASVRPNTSSDYLPMSFAMIGVCVPSFVLGPLLIMAFCFHFQWFDFGGWDTASQKVLPAITLGAAYAAYIARLARGSMLEVLSQDFIRTAKAKGLTPLRIVLKHALRNGVLPVVTFLGPSVAMMITGSFVTESIFGIDGLGRIIVNAAFDRDYLLIMGTVLLFGTLMIFLNMFSDLALGVLNPRVRLSDAK